MQHVGCHYSSGNPVDFHQMHFPSATENTTNASASVPTTTSVLRSWRKKDASEKQTTPTEPSNATTGHQTSESQGPVARVAPHNHYPKPPPPLQPAADAYRYPQQYGDFGLQGGGQQLPTTVKYSEIIEPPSIHQGAGIGDQQPGAGMIPPIHHLHHQKPKEPKSYLEMCGGGGGVGPNSVAQQNPNQQHAAKSYHHQDYQTYKQHYDGLKGYNHLGPAYKQQFHPVPPHPYHPQKESQMGYPAQKEAPQYHNYKMSPPPNYPPRSYPRDPGGNEFLASLNKIAPDMAQDIINDPHLREAQFPPIYPPPVMEQNRLYHHHQQQTQQQQQYHHHQRVYHQRSSPIQHQMQNYPPPPPQRNLTQGYNQYPLNQRAPPTDPYGRMYGAPPPHQRYGGEQVPNNISPTRQYHENMMGGGFPPRISPNYPPCTQLEYAQHYQHHRQVPPPPMRQEYLPVVQPPPPPPPPSKPYMETHPEIPEIVPEDSISAAAATKSTLKTFLENWREEFAEEVESGEHGTAEKIQLVKSAVQGRDNTLYVLDTLEIPSENIPQYLHLQPIEKLPANIRTFAAAYSNANEDGNPRQNLKAEDVVSQGTRKPHEDIDRRDPNAYQLFQQSKNGKPPDAPGFIYQPYKHEDASTHEDRPACKLLQSMANAKNAQNGALADARLLEKHLNNSRPVVCSRSLPELITEDAQEANRNREEQMESEYSKIVDSILEEKMRNVDGEAAGEDATRDGSQRKSVIAANLHTNHRPDPPNEEGYHDEERTITKVTNDHHLEERREEEESAKADHPRATEEDPIDLSHHLEDELPTEETEDNSSGTPDENEEGEDDEFDGEEEEPKHVYTDILSFKDVLRSPKEIPEDCIEEDAAAETEEVEEAIEETPQDCEDASNSKDEETVPETDASAEETTENVSGEQEESTEVIQESEDVDNSEHIEDHDIVEDQTVKADSDHTQEDDNPDSYHTQEETVVELTILDENAEEIEYVEDPVACADEDPSKDENKEKETILLREEHKINEEHTEEIDEELILAEEEEVSSNASAEDLNSMEEIEAFTDEMISLEVNTEEADVGAEEEIVEEDVESCVSFEETLSHELEDKELSTPEETIEEENVEESTVEEEMDSSFEESTRETNNNYISDLKETMEASANLETIPEEEVEVQNTKEEINSSFVLEIAKELLQINVTEGADGEKVIVVTPLTKVKVIAPPTDFKNEEKIESEIDENSNCDDSAIIDEVKQLLDETIAEVVRTREDIEVQDDPVTDESYHEMGEEIVANEVEINEEIFEADGHIMEEELDLHNEVIIDNEPEEIQIPLEEVSDSVVPDKDPILVTNNNYIEDLSCVRTYEHQDVNTQEKSIETPESHTHGFKKIENLDSVERTKIFSSVVLIDKIPVDLIKSRSGKSRKILKQKSKRERRFTKDGVSRSRFKRRMGLVKEMRQKLKKRARKPTEFAVNSAFVVKDGATEKLAKTLTELRVSPLSNGAIDSEKDAPLPIQSKTTSMDTPLQETPKEAPTVSTAAEKDQEIATTPSIEPLPLKIDPVKDSQAMVILSPLGQHQIESLHTQPQEIDPIKPSQAVTSRIDAEIPAPPSTQNQTGLLDSPPQRTDPIKRAEVINKPITSRKDREVVTAPSIRNEIKSLETQSQKIEHSQEIPLKIDAGIAKPPSIPNQTVSMDSQSQKADPVKHSVVNKATPSERDPEIVTPPSIQKQIEPLETQSRKIESLETQSRKIESVEAQSRKIESLETQSRKIESLETQSRKIESLETQSPKIESTEAIPLKKDNEIVATPSVQNQIRSLDTQEINTIKRSHSRKEQEIATPPSIESQTDSAKTQKINPMSHPQVNVIVKKPTSSQTVEEIGTPSSRGVRTLLLEDPQRQKIDANKNAPAPPIVSKSAVKKDKEIPVAPPTQNQGSLSQPPKLIAIKEVRPLPILNRLTHTKRDPSLNVPSSLQYPAKSLNTLLSRNTQIKDPRSFPMTNKPTYSRPGDKITTTSSLQSPTPRTHAIKDPQNVTIVPPPHQIDAKPSEPFQAPRGTLRPGRQQKDLRRTKSGDYLNSKFLDNFKKRRLSLEEYNSRKRKALDKGGDAAKHCDDSKTETRQDKMVEEVLKSLKSEEMDVAKSMEKSEDVPVVQSAGGAQDVTRSIEEKVEGLENEEISSKPAEALKQSGKLPPADTKKSEDIVDKPKDSIDKFAIEEKLNSLEEFLPKIAPKDPPIPRKPEEADLSRKLDEFLAENPISYTQKFNETDLIERFLNHKTLTPEELQKVKQIVHCKRAIRSIQQNSNANAPKRRYSSEYPKSIKIDFNDFDLKKTETDVRVQSAKVCYNRSISAFVEQESKRSMNPKARKHPVRQSMEELNKTIENEKNGPTPNAPSINLSSVDTRNDEKISDKIKAAEGEKKQDVIVTIKEGVKEVSKEEFSSKNKHSILSIISDRGKSAQISNPQITTQIKEKSSVKHSIQHLIKRPETNSIPVVPEPPKYVQEQPTPVQTKCEDLPKGIVDNSKDRECKSSSQGIEVKPTGSVEDVVDTQQSIQGKQFPNSQNEKIPTIRTEPVSCSKPISKTKAQLKCFQDSKPKLNDTKEQSPVISNLTKLTALLTYYKKGLESGADSENLKRIEEIIDRLSPNLRNLPNLPEVVPSNEYEVSPETSATSTSSSSNLRLHLKKVPSSQDRKKKKRFRNLYTENESDEDPPKPKEARLEKEDTDYSVYQRKSPAGVPKLVIKRRKSDFKGGLQPYVKINRMPGIEIMVKRRRRSIFLNQDDFAD